MRTVISGLQHCGLAARVRCGSRPTRRCTASLCPVCGLWSGSCLGSRSRCRAVHFPLHAATSLQSFTFSSRTITPSSIPALLWRSPSLPTSYQHLYHSAIASRLASLRRGRRTRQTPNRLGRLASGAISGLKFASAITAPTVIIRIHPASTGTYRSNRFSNAATSPLVPFLAPPSPHI